MSDDRCVTPGCPGDGRYSAPGRGHVEGCRHPVPPTDPAVTAAAEALTTGWTGDPPEAWALTIARTAVAAARPIIEAEVRERIAADIEAEAARRTARIISPYDRAHRDGLLSAERIARGQS